MGERPPRARLVAVADAGPLIHLAEVQREAAWKVFGSVVIPEPVAEELQAGVGLPGSGVPTGRPFQRRPPALAERKAAEALSLRYEIGLVDAVVLAMAKARSSLVLTDDLDLREATRLTGVQPVGSIGILLRAATAGLLSRQEAEDGLESLQQRSSLHVTRALIDEAKAALRRSVG